MTKDNQLAPGQSRWGFHPCNYELFCKLRELHKWYWQTMYDFHRWHRWWRKEPQNRGGPEPKYCEIFSERAVWHRETRRRGERGYKIYPRTLIDHNLCALYQSVRMPQKEPVPPLDAEQQSTIVALHKAVAEFFVE